MFFNHCLFSYENEVVAYPPPLCNSGVGGKLFFMTKHFSARFPSPPWTHAVQTSHTHMWYLSSYRGMLPPFVAIWSFRGRPCHHLYHKIHFITSDVPLSACIISFVFHTASPPLLSKSFYPHDEPSYHFSGSASPSGVITPSSRIPRDALIGCKRAPGWF